MTTSPMHTMDTTTMRPYPCYHTHGYHTYAWPWLLNPCVAYFTLRCILYTLHYNGKLPNHTPLFGDGV